MVIILFLVNFEILINEFKVEKNTIFALEKNLNFARINFREFRELIHFQNFREN